MVEGQQCYIFVDIMVILVGVGFGIGCGFGVGWGFGGRSFVLVNFILFCFF